MSKFVSFDPVVRFICLWVHFFYVVRGFETRFFFFLHLVAHYYFFFGELFFLLIRVYIFFSLDNYLSDLISLRRGFCIVNGKRFFFLAETRRCQLNISEKSFF